MIENVFHIYPKNEEGEHFLECVYPPIGAPYCPCICNPEWKEEDNCILIVHTSFEGIEGVEWANEIINPDKKQ